MSVQEFSELVSECVFVEIETVDSITEQAAEGVHNFTVRLSSGETFSVIVRR